MYVMGSMTRYEQAAYLNLETLNNSLQEQFKDSLLVHIGLKTPS